MDISTLLKQGAELCLSGLREEDVDCAKQIYSRFFNFPDSVSFRTSNQWVCIIGTRNSASVEEYIDAISESAL